MDALLREARSLHHTLDLRVKDRLQCAGQLACQAQASIADAKALLSPPPPQSSSSSSATTTALSVKGPATLVVARSELRACVGSQLGVVGEVEGWGVGFGVRQDVVDEVCRAIGVMGEVTKTEGARFAAAVSAPPTSRTSHDTFTCVCCCVALCGGMRAWGWACRGL